ncbi:MAG: penicillin-binding transpeptidase domain-containing protein, partial [Anaerolineae bacterium]
MNRVWSRRVFLKLALGTLASACTAHLGESTMQRSEEPHSQGPLSLLASSTASPSPTPSPLPSPDGTAAAFLSAWTSGDYATMYNLVCQADRNTISFEAFRERYLRAQTEATVTAIQNELRAVLARGSSASASFRTVWQTSLFGPLSFDNALPLVWEGGRWAVDWSSTLVLPALGEDLTLVLLNRTAPRGNIYERNGLGLAVQGKMVEVGVVPGRLPDDPSQVIAQLSAITGVTPQMIRKKIEVARPEWFVSIAHVKPEVSITNDDLLRQLPGVERRESTVRAYTNGTLAAHLIGYLGAITAEELPTWRARGYLGDELVGRSGVEGWGETILAGKRGGRLVTLTRQNREATLIAEAPPRPGDSIYLSIDKGLQADAENILGQRPGAIVVLEVNTGFVLAMASYPRFDPNLFVNGIDPTTWTALVSDPNRPLLERCAQGVYPPGSVFKVVTMMAGMEHLGLTPDTTYTCLGTWNRLGNAFVKTCWLKAGHGTISLREGLTQSCDVVFYEVGLALQNRDPQILPDVARACGLG